MNKIHLYQIFHALLHFNWIHIISVSLDKTAKLWHLSSGVCLKSINIGAPIQSLGVSQGRFDLLRSVNSPPQLFDHYLNIDSPLSSEVGTVASIISESGSMAATSSINGKIEVIDLKLMEKKTILNDAGQGKQINCLEFSSSLKEIIFTIDDTIQIQPIDGTGLKRHIKTDSRIVQLKIYRVKKFGPSFTMGDKIVTQHENGDLKIHNIYQVFVKKLNQNESEITAMTLSENYLILGCKNGKIVLQDMSIKEMLIFNNEFKTGCSVTSIDQKNDLIIAGCETGELILQDVKTRNVLRRFQGHNDIVTSIAFDDYKK